MSKELTTETGEAIELLPGGLVRVRLRSNEEITAHVAEEFRRVAPAVRPGDRVEVRRATKDPRRGSIVGVSK